MSASPLRIRPLLLMVGISSRTGSPKYLLRHPTGQPTYLRTLKLLRMALPSAEEIGVSIRSAEQMAELTEGNDSQVCFVSDSSVLSDLTKEDDIGPAAGLLAAHDHDKSAHRLVLGYDFPLPTVRALEQLINDCEEPLTCLDGTDGSSEPFFAIWSPSALGK
ncbi:hypothetical protein LTR62_002323 [Meristemomyces frigidus]|uniref:MobA-like NTP transferase domain-containing protein n=1 Tax=Meristemomyces frigidus TaxID=1508187 RepID=A0AAN7YFV2_9PEZI|nr:hypothetical protein LTR62_002323 [Meristemomyces frigidus]